VVLGGHERDFVPNLAEFRVKVYFTGYSLFLTFKGQLARLFHTPGVKGVGRVLAPTRTTPDFHVLPRLAKKFKKKTFF
jgi:hypothetical protein